MARYETLTLDRRFTVTDPPSEEDLLAEVARQVRDSVGLDEADFEVEVYRKDPTTFRVLVKSKPRGPEETWVRQARQSNWHVITVECDHPTGPGT